MAFDSYIPWEIIVVLSANTNSTLNAQIGFEISFSKRILMLLHLEKSCYNVPFLLCNIHTKIRLL